MLIYISLQLLYLIAVMGIFVSLVTHVWLYFHIGSGGWVFGLVIFVPALTFSGLMIVVGEISKKVTPDKEQMLLGFREALRRLPLWKKIGIGFGVFSGILISAIFTYIIPSTQLSAESFSACAITTYSCLLAGVYWMKYRVLNIQLSSSNISERIEAMFILAKLRDRSVIPLLAAPRLLRALQSRGNSPSFS